MKGRSEKNDRTGREDAAAERAAALIREKSSAGRLVSESEIISLLEEERRKCPDSLFTRLPDENEDVHRLSGAGSHFYYSSRHMTEIYARLLLLKLEGPLRLIAETVRRNSCACRRPVPLDLFTQPPFNLTRQEVLDSLAEMSRTEGWEDIAVASTSASVVFLYSRAHLETGHAEMLAEWLDVGQVQNP
ncbi:MAG: hypothetical protein PHG91_08835 [Syntrophales bacterium]|nr:hypothetical protein [Syntrophales bacterium]MDD5233488.1 hypothetical protein [Syntrophales bacterium]MDD5533457.1 hypothetical protein [Syntrophales bacterium]